MATKAKSSQGKTKSSDKKKGKYAVSRTKGKSNNYRVRNRKTGEVKGEFETRKRANKKEKKLERKAKKKSSDKKK